MTAAKTNPRRAAYDALLAVERGAYANLALKDALAPLADEKMRAFASALFYTALEHKLTLEFYLRHFATKRVPPAIRCVLMIGLAQMIYMKVPAHAAIDESVKLVRAIGKSDSAAFVNALLRNVDRHRDELPLPQGGLVERLSIELSAPVWLVERHLNRFGEEGCRALLTSRASEGVCLRANPFRCSEAECDAILSRDGLAFRSGTIVPEARIATGIGDLVQWPPFREGKVAVQGESSMLAARVADARPGMRVLDACAAPGGKCAYLAAAMQDGTLHAWDLHPHRVKLIEANCERLGIAFVQSACRDASVYDPNFEDRFDLVFVDAPCSGLGVIGGKPDIKYAKTPEMIGELAALQAKILHTCARYVAPGGALVYATCTIAREENEDQIAAFLRDHPSFAPGEIGFAFPESFDRERIRGGMVQLLPQIDGVDGFFVARLQRRMDTI